jgi:hypothetical protein
VARPDAELHRVPEVVGVAGAATLVGTSAGVCTAGCSIGSAATGLCTGDDKGGATKVLAAVCEADSAGADPRCGGTPGPFPGGGILTDATTVGRDAFQIAVVGDAATG